MRKNARSNQWPYFQGMIAVLFMIACLLLMPTGAHAQSSDWDIPDNAVPAVESYIVQEGDTLLSVAQDYDRHVEEILLLTELVRNTQGLPPLLDLSMLIASEWFYNPEINGVSSTPKFRHLVSV